jgi:hypothetical protein
MDNLYGMILLYVSPLPEPHLQENYSGRDMTATGMSWPGSSGAMDAGVRIYDVSGGSDGVLSSGPNRAKIL